MVHEDEDPAAAESAIDKVPYNITILLVQRNVQSISWCEFLSAAPRW